LPLSSAGASGINCLIFSLFSFSKSVDGGVIISPYLMRPLKFKFKIVKIDCSKQAGEEKINGGNIFII
jgi:hypothetical protein